MGVGIAGREWHSRNICCISNHLLTALWLPSINTLQPTICILISRAMRYMSCLMMIKVVVWSNLLWTRQLVSTSQLCGEFLTWLGCPTSCWLLGNCVEWYKDLVQGVVSTNDHASVVTSESDSEAISSLPPLPRKKDGLVSTAQLLDNIPAWVIWPLINCCLTA